MVSNLRIQSTSATFLVFPALMPLLLSLYGKRGLFRHLALDAHQAVLGGGVALGLILREQHREGPLEHLPRLLVFKRSVYGVHQAYGIPFQVGEGAGVSALAECKELVDELLPKLHIHIVHPCPEGLVLALAAALYILAVYEFRAHQLP